MIVAGRFDELRKRDGGVFWDDRDPARKSKDGTVSGYIFRRVDPCNVDLGSLKVEHEGDKFYLIDNGVRVCVVLVNYFHDKNADVYIETFEPFRRRGYATKLLGWVSDWLADNGYIHEGGCAADNLPSLLLHLKLGFQVVGHIRWSRESKKTS
jgi:GNAT superfamily N-acetyltransferase